MATEIASQHGKYTIVCFYYTFFGFWLCFLVVLQLMRPLLIPLENLGNV